MKGISQKGGKIIWLPLDQIRPYENNPRKNDAAVPKVAASIRRFGFRVPLILDSDHVIVAGHTRYKAAQELGLTAAPVMIADDLTPDEVKAYRLADNKVAEAAEWDDEKLDVELLDLQDSELLETEDFTMEEFGFDLIGQEDEDEFEIPPAPTNLDAGEGYNEDAILSVKLTFANYDAYRVHEAEIKATAERMGAVFSVVKV